MERKAFGCMICSEEFTSVGKFKQHLLSARHKQEYMRVYPVDNFRRNERSFTPCIFIKDPRRIYDRPRPILGLSQMILCFSSEVRNPFYLCHVCEQKFPVYKIMSHITHVNHYSNYFAYTDPNALQFISVPTEQNPLISLSDNIKKEHEQTGIGELQLLHMPERLFNECISRSYCQVMFLLHQNKFLPNRLKEKKPERMRIQTYKDDSNRMHPLIGLQYIVECICNPHTHLRTYLCTLCNLQLSSSMILRHLLSFDHVYNSISKWNPSTLKEKDFYRKDTCTLADVAKQSEELHGPQEIQQVKLETSQMLSVLNTYFKQALGEVESIANKGSLIPTVKPGNKLDPTLPESSKITTNVKQESTSEPETSKSTNLTQNVKEENGESTIEQSATPAAPSYSFHCQNCSKNFETSTLYFKHLSTCEHLENLTKTFGAVIDKSSECMPHFHSYKYFTEPDVLCAGVSLVVTLLSCQLKSDPVHLCFACETVFSRKDLKSHMNSERHLVRFLMYQNPWKLPFAWKTKLDYQALKLKACTEEEERRPIKNIKILDVPSCLFPCETLLSFSNVMEKLDQYHPLIKNGVPQQETYNKLQDNDGFPILGMDFLVKYGQTTSGWKFLCLLCERSITSDDYTGHVFSWEHVVAFLEKFHPGTLDLNTTDEEMLLDFAKQAARIHSISNAQEIEVDITPRYAYVKMDHSSKVRLLTAEQERNGKGPLMPPITPGMKLFPRQRTQQKDLNLDIKTPNPEIDPENPVEKLVDGFQSTEQVSHEPMDISLQKINNFPTEQDLKKNSPMIQPSQSEEMASDCKAMISTAAASKKQRSESDMDTSDSDRETLKPKRMCLSNLSDKESRSDLQSVDTQEQSRSSDRAVDTAVPCYGSELRSYVKNKIRNPMIGLSAVHECVFNDSPPIYLCGCCRLKFDSDHIINHLSEAWHYKSYLESASEYYPPDCKSWKRDMAKYAAYWERTEGHGETRVVELIKEDYDSVEKASGYSEAIRVVRKYSVRKVNCSTALHENLAKAVTSNRQETSQQAMQMEIDPASVETSSNTATIVTQTSDLDQSHATDADGVIQSLGSTVTITSATPAVSFSNLLGNAKSVPRDESETTNVEDPNLKMENVAYTGATISSKPLCKFIIRSVIPEVEPEPVNTEINKENAIDEILYTTSASCIAATPKPTCKPTCKFMAAKSAKNKSSSPITTPASACTSDIATPNTQQTASPLLVDKVTSRALTPDVSVSNAMKEDTSVQPYAVLKAEPPYSSGIKAPTESSSSQPKLPSAASIAFTPKSSDTHSKPKGIQLNLNVNAASHVKNDPVHTGGSLTPTTPKFGLLMPTAEKSQKDSAQTPKVGLDHVVKAKCKEKRLLYCLACLIKMEASNHLTSMTHQINCVKLKFPQWSPKPDEDDLSQMVALLHSSEQALKKECKQIEVSPDTYKELKGLSDDKAIEKIKNMLKRKSSKKPVHRRPSASTSDASNNLSDISTSPNISSWDATSPYLGNENGQTNPQIKITAQLLKNMPVMAMPAPTPNSQAQKPTSKVAPWIIKGSTTDELSTLSRILAVKATSVIGLCLVWECRVMPPKHPTFYLCESCSVTMSVNEICGHMKSTKHCFMYLMRQYPRFMYWTEEELDPAMTEEMTNGIASFVKRREESMDAQTVLLSEEWFKLVRKAPFVEALNMVQMIKQEKKMTSLLPNVTSQPEVEQREQQRTQLTVDTNTLTDLPNKMEISTMEKADGIMDTQHQTFSEGNIACENTESCASATDTNCMSSQMIEFLDSQSDSVASTNSQQEPDEPTYSAAEQNFVPSPKDENQEHFDPDTQASESDVTSPLSLNLAAMSPLVDTIKTISLETLTNKSTDSKPKTDIQLCLPSVQETSTVNQNHIKETVSEVKDEDQMIEENSPHSNSDTNVESVSFMASSMVDQNASEYPALDPNDKTDEQKAALDKHYYLMLINLLKQTKNSRQQATSTRNQSPEPCSAKAPESKVELCEEPHHTQWNIGQPPKTDNDATDSVCNIETKNKSGSSAELQIQNSICTDVSNENTDKPTFVEVIPVSNKRNPTRSELSMHSQGEFVQSKDEPIKESPVKKPLVLLKKLLQEKQTKIIETETENNVLDLYIQNISSKTFTHTSHDLLKGVQLDCGVQLQTQQAHVQVPQQTEQNQELQLQPQVLQSLNYSQQNQSQKEQGQSNTVTPLQPQTQMVPTHVTQQTQGHTEEVPIYSHITSRHHNAMYFSDVDDQQNASFPTVPPSFVASPSVTSGNMVVTGDHGQYAHTAYSTNAWFTNNESQPGVHHGCYPSHIYHQQQTQQNAPVVQPFLQNVQHPGVQGWCTPNTQQQPVAQNSSAWYNGTVGGASNVAHSNAMPFNTVHNQSYTYHSVQEYNRVTVQNVFYPYPMQSQAPGQFFPPRQ